MFKGCSDLILNYSYFQNLYIDHCTSYLTVIPYLLEHCQIFAQQGMQMFLEHCLLISMTQGKVK